MNRGYIKIYRKTLDSRVFQSEGLLKVWLWCLLEANHRGAWVTVKTGRGATEVWIEPGQFIFGRISAAKKLKMKPSTVWKRILKLKNMQNLNIESNTLYSIITILNWGTYQGESKKGDIEGDSEGTAKEHKQECKECKEERTPEKILSEISVLRDRYQDQGTINQALQAIASTRKSNRITDSVKLSILQSWNRYPVESVMTGIRTYLEKGYAGKGKGEKYLLGIIRNLKPEVSLTDEQVMKSTGSHALDEHYRSQGYRIV